MTTDRKNFDFPPCRGIMTEIEYPGIAKLVSRLVWDQETVRSSRTTRTKIPLKSTISEGFSYSLSIVAQTLSLSFLTCLFDKRRLNIVIFAALYYNKCGNIGKGARYERKQVPKMSADYPIFFTSLFPYIN